MMRFTLIGDSNSKRHMNSLNCRDRPAMASAELKVCGRLEILSETIRSVRFDTTAVILACITNFITSTTSDSTSSSATASQRVEPVLKEMREILHNFCQEQPDRSWFLAPPMYRTTPQWYLDGLSEIMVMFSSTFRSDKPGNLYLLPSFPSPELEQDGVHLLPYSGFQFVTFLFDSVDNVFKNCLKAPAMLLPHHTESIRSLEDRVSVIEQDHRRLNKSVETKAAINAEASDYAENQR